LRLGSIELLACWFAEASYPLTAALDMSVSPSAAAAAAALAQGGRLVDCSHTITPSTLSFASHFNLAPDEATGKTAGYVMGRTFDSRTADGKGFQKCIFSLPCDVGTHIDAPSHWFEAGRDVSQLTLEELTAPGAVVDVTAQVEADCGYALSLDDLHAFEAKHGRIPARALVVAKTGWSRRDITDTAAFVNGMHFPGFSAAAARWLLAERDIAGLGIDTPSLDVGKSAEYPVHAAVLGADRYQVENMKLCGVPAGLGAVFVCLPLKVGGAPESETRVMAIVPSA
jgi:kynurenine formamidase